MCIYSISLVLSAKFVWLFNKIWFKIPSIFKGSCGIIFIIFTVLYEVIKY